MQDSKGYLWIATDAGVVKYDGYNFVTYNNSNGLPDNTVFKIREDRKGRIWFASYSGKMAYYSHNSDSIFEITANKTLDQITDHYPVDFTFDSHDTLFVSISRRGYVKIHPPHYARVQHYNYERNCYFIRRVQNGNCIYGTSFHEKSFYREFVPLICDKGDSKSNIDTSFKVKASIAHLGLVYESDTSVLFSNGTAIYSVSEHAKRTLYRYAGNVNKTVSLFRDNQKRLWLNGLNEGTRVVERFDFENPAFHFLKAFSVSSVCQDRENGYWISTLEDGLYYIPSLNFSFIDKSDGLPANKVLSISLLNGKLKCLTSDFSMSEIDLNSNQIKVNEKFKSAAWYISQSDKYLLFCSNNPYIMKAGSAIKVPLWVSGENGVREPVRVRRAIDYDADYFLGFDQGDLLMVHKETGECKLKPLNLPNIFSVMVQKEKVWIGTKSGLYLYNGKRIEYMGNAHPLLKSRAEDMISCGDSLWIATRGNGVLCLFQDSVVKQYTELNGLASNMTKCIIKDALGSIWIGTNRGISRLTKNKDNIYMVGTVNMNSGLVSNEVNKMVAYNHKLYFATNKGLGILNVNDFYDPKLSIPVYIEEIFIDNEKVKAVPVHRLSHQQNIISFNYKGVCIKESGGITYKYKLVGLDTSWTYSKNTYVQYTTLPSGNYLFIVYALNQDGNSFYPPATVNFVIDTPLWQTWWFILTCIVLFFTVLLLLYRNRIERIKKDEKEKSAVAKKLAEYELKALRAQMNPHFMFNAINSIQNFVLKNNTKYASLYLSKFARLIRFVLDNSRHQLILFTKELAALELYIELEQMRASFSFDYEIVIEESLNSKEFFIPPLLIQPYIENAIIHGIMPLQDRRGKLSVRFSRNKTTLQCEVEDNGIGREKALEIRTRKQLTHQSIGMEVTRDRISLMNKQQDSISTIHVEDLYTHGIASGTLVKISINLKTSLYD
jgi:sensor histidine kinase YesM